MTSSKFAVASLFALGALVAGAAQAGTALPDAGEAPFARIDSTPSSVSRSAVRDEALRGFSQIDTGDVVHAVAPVANAPVMASRAEVRAQAQQATRAGHGPAAGEQS